MTDVVYGKKLNSRIRAETLRMAVCGKVGDVCSGLGLITEGELPCYGASPNSVSCSLGVVSQQERERGSSLD